jgi:hypothetical protein
VVACWAFVIGLKKRNRNKKEATEGKGVADSLGKVSDSLDNKY